MEFYSIKTERNGNVTQRLLGSVRFTIEDAKRAKLTDKKGPGGGPGNWEKFPGPMCLARATTSGARTHCADVFGGPIFTPDEIGAVIDMSETGEIVAVHDSGTVGAAPAPDGTATRNVTPSGAPNRQDVLREVRKLHGHTKSSLSGEEMKPILDDVSAVLGREIKNLGEREITTDALLTYLNRKRAKQPPETIEQQNESAADAQSPSEPTTVEPVTEPMTEDTVQYCSGCGACTSPPSKAEPHDGACPGQETDGSLFDGIAS